jgi:hypothetical protein
LHYLGAVFHDTGMFRKSEERRCPVSTVSVYSRVAFCFDSIAKVLEDPTLSGGFDRDKRIHYTFQMLMEQQGRLRRSLRQKVGRVYPVRKPFNKESQSVSP